MKFTRAYMTDYLLSFCSTLDERDEMEAHLNALTDEELWEEFITEYNALCGNCPNPPLYEDQFPDIYIDF